MLTWYLICLARRRCPDRFYSYIGFGIWLIPTPDTYDPWTERLTNNNCEEP
jgi:hypothetical protein